MWLLGVLGIMLGIVRADITLIHTSGIGGVSSRWPELTAAINATEQKLCNNNEVACLVLDSGNYFGEPCCCIVNMRASFKFISVLVCYELRKRCDLLKF